MSVHAQNFLNRLPESAVDERKIVSLAFAIPEMLARKAEEIRANPRLSEVGKADEIRAIATGGMAERFLQNRRAAEQMAADVANLRAGMKPKPIDRTDLFSELQRRERRDFLRSLPEQQRTRTAFEPEYADAIVNAPAAMSGLSKEVHARVSEAALERQLGPQLTGLKAREEQIQVINSALAVAARQFRNAGGLKEGEI